MIVLALFVLAKIIAPDAQITAALALFTGVVHGARFMRWKGWAVLAEPLMWVLHLGYAWLVLALVLLGLAGLTDIVPRAAAIHALTAGAFSTGYRN